MSDTEIRQRRHDWAAGTSAPGSPGQPDEIRAPASIDELEFAPQPMVAWYSPKELIVTGFRAAVSAIFGTYADKREIESVLAVGEWQDYSDYLHRNGEIWIDYVADLGDGWSSTYTIARLLAEERLGFDANLNGVSEKGVAANATVRGNVLIMGGDQVYPAANHDEYRNRLIGPYRCALPGVYPSDQAPHLFMVPGNHDWYDGLNSFFQLFCQQRWIGGWRTQQNRSYFSFKLDELLWVWGVDIQLSSNIDQPQLDYFDKVAKTMEKGSKIILCTAEPSWAYVEMNTTQQKNPILREREKERIYKNLGHFEKTIVHKYEHDVLIALAGDAHNYTRYEAEDGTGNHRFVSGGGGAYLFPTHNMPESLTMPRRFGGEKYTRKKVFPAKDESEKLANRTPLFPFIGPNWRFSAFLGSFYLLLAWVMQSVSKISSGGAVGATLLDRFAVNFDAVAFIRVLAHSPGSVAFLLVLLAGLVAFSPYVGMLKKAVHGGLHTLAHVGLFMLLIYAFAHINVGMLGLDVDDWKQAILFGLEMLLFGGILGAIVFGLYIWISNRFVGPQDFVGLHDNEVLLCQSNPDYKNFLRFRIRTDGTITIFPVGVPRVVRRKSWSFDSIRRSLAGWTLKPDAAGGAAWFEPDEGAIQSHAKLIEEPITVSFERRSPD